MFAANASRYHLLLSLAAIACCYLTASYGLRPSFARSYRRLLQPRPSRRPTVVVSKRGKTLELPAAATRKSGSQSRAFFRREANGCSRVFVAVVFSFVLHSLRGAVDDRPHGSPLAPQPLRRYKRPDEWTRRVMPVGSMRSSPLRPSPPPLPMASFCCCQQCLFVIDLDGYEGYGCEVMG